MPQERYSKVAMGLHWLIAGLLAFQVGLADAWENAPNRLQAFDVAQFHMAIGISILILTSARVVVRFTKPRPDHQADATWAVKLSGIVHFLFYAVMIMAPLTGWLAVSTGRVSAPFDMFGLFHFPLIPGLDDLSADVRHTLHSFGEQAHGFVAKLLVPLFLLHVVGALRHQLLLRQPTIERMLLGGRMLAPVGGSIAILGCAAFIIAILMWGSTGPAPKGDPSILKSIMEQRAALEEK
jgi:cytochrome b561